MHGSLRHSHDFPDILTYLGATPQKNDWPSVEGDLMHKKQDHNANTWQLPSVQSLTHASPELL